jgi:hypothetical protein
MQSCARSPPPCCARSQKRDPFLKGAARSSHSDCWSVKRLHAAVRDKGSVGRSRCSMRSRRRSCRYGRRHGICYRGHRFGPMQDAFNCIHRCVVSLPVHDKCSRSDVGGVVAGMLASCLVHPSSCCGLSHNMSVDCARLLSASMLIS